MKQVFSKDKYIEDMVNKALKSKWLYECEGLTRNQMRMLGYNCDENWLIDLDESAPVFSAYLFHEEALAEHTPYDLIVASFATWVPRCEGKTKKEVSELGYFFKDEWFEVPENDE